MKSPKILIVEDPVVCIGLKQLFKKEKYDITFVFNKVEAIAKLKINTPNLCLISYSNRRDGSFVTFIKSLIAAKPGLLALFGDNERNYTRDGLRLGLAAYIPKTASSETILSAIKTILGGKVWICPSMKDLLIGDTINIEGYSKKRDLSKRQEQVFVLLGKGFNTKLIADELCISIKTIDTHYASIKDKLGISNMSEMFARAVSMQP